jgi:hypothetical protein
MAPPGAARQQLATQRVEILARRVTGTDDALHGAIGYGT